MPKIVSDMSAILFCQGKKQFTSGENLASEYYAWQVETIDALNTTAYLFS